MCESGRSQEGHSTRANNFSISSSLDLDVTCSSSLTQLAMALAATKVSRFEKAAGQNLIEKLAYLRRPGDGKRARFESRCCPRVLSKTRRFYSAYSWEPLPAKLQDN